MITVGKIEKIINKFPKDVIVEFCKTILRREGYVIRDPEEIENMRMRAYKKRQEKSIKIIKECVKEFKKEGKNRITVYAVAKRTGLNYATVKKYSYLLQMQGQ